MDYCDQLSTQCNVKAVSKANVKTGSKANVEAGFKAKVETGSKANVEAGSKANVEAGSEAWYTQICVCGNHYRLGLVVVKTNNKKIELKYLKLS